MGAAQPDMPCHRPSSAAARAASPPEAKQETQGDDVIRVCTAPRGLSRSLEHNQLRALPRALYPDLVAGMLLVDGGGEWTDPALRRGKFRSACLPPLPPLRVSHAACLSPRVP